MSEKCLECGVKFIDEIPEHWFDCSVCGATHVFFDGKWMLEDERFDILEKRRWC